MSRRVSVLLGGPSAERDVSLVSGRQCADALARKGWEVNRVDPAEPGWIGTLEASPPDIVFNALHGTFGEDGTVQGVLESLKLPYTHSGVLASALAMDKTRAKVHFAHKGLDVPEGRLIRAGDIRRAHPLDRPYVVKPNADGSSVGVHIVHELTASPPQPEGEDEEWLLVEEFIPGRELTVAVFQGRAFCVTEIVTGNRFYDYSAKYLAGGSRHILPADLPADITQKALDIALTAHESLGCKGITRSDLRFCVQTNRLALLEINTQPGMTPTSLAPEQAAHCGIAFDDLVEAMAEDASWPR